MSDDPKKIIDPINGTFDDVAARMVRPSKGVAPKAPKPRKNAKTRAVEELIEGYPASEVRLATILCGDEQRALEGLRKVFPLDR